MSAVASLTAQDQVSAVVGHPQLAADAVFQLTGTFVGTVTFEACQPENAGTAANWFPIGVSAIATPGTIVTTAAAPGIWKTKDAWAGGLLVRARCSAFTSGTITVTASTSDY